MHSPLSQFRHLPLSPAMLAALDAAGYDTPTPIQARAIEPALAGRDVLGAAQTGTGKTAAFLVPVVERLRSGGGSALILSPTRELAEQTFRWAERLGGHGRGALVVGGLGYEPQRLALRRQPAIVVATPGRLVDHLERGAFSLSTLRILVLDEADRMLDLGFKPQLQRILRACPASRQTLLFSATLPAHLGPLAWIQLRDPVRVDVGQSAVPPSQARQDVYLVEHERKTPLLLSLLEREAGRVLVFTRTKHRTDRLARAVLTAGHAAERLHSDRTQSQRRAALHGFRCGQYRVLIATDVAARGLDVPSIQRVINYDLPHTAEDYVHRVGRTARAAAVGHASSFAAPEERAQLSAIEHHIGQPLPRLTHDSTRAPGLREERARATNHAPVPIQPAGHDWRHRRARQGRELGAHGRRALEPLAHLRPASDRAARRRRKRR